MPVDQLMQGLASPPLLEYKYVLLGLNGDTSSSEWESLEGNRSVMLTYVSITKDTGLINLRDTFN